MSSNERILRFRAEMDNAQAKRSADDLRSALSNNFADISKVSKGALQGLNHELTTLARSVPVIGQPLAGVTRAFLALKPEVSKVSEETKSFNRILDDIGKVTGRSREGLTSFLGTFRTFTTDSQKARAALKEFGGEGLALIPKLEQAGAQMANVTAQTAAASGGFAALAGPIGIAIAGITAVIGAEIALGSALFSVSEKWAAWGDSIYKAQQKTGQTAEQLSVIKFATEELKREAAGASVNFDQVIRGIARFEANVSRSVTNPSRQAAQALTALGLSAQELKNMTPDEAFRKLMVSLDGMKNRMDRDRAAADLFGRDFQNLIPIMDALGKNFDQTKARAEALGLVFSGKAAAQARQFMQSMKDAELAGKGLAISFGAQVGPEITRVLRLIMAETTNVGSVATITGKLIGGIIRNEVEGAITLIALLKTAADLARRAGNPNPADLGRGILGAKDFYLTTRRELTDAMNVPLPEISQGDTDVTFPSKDNAAEKARREAIRVLEEEQQRIEEDYRRHTERLQREYDALRTSSQTYTKDLITEAEARLTGLESALNRELALAKKQSERDDINNKLLKARREKETTVEKAQDDQDKRELDALKKHREALIGLGDKYDAMAEGNIRARAEANAISYEASENQIYDLQTKAFDRRLQALRDDEARFYKQSKDINDVNLEVAQEYSDKIAALVAEQERREDEHLRRVDEMRQKDLERRRIYLDNFFDLQKQYEETDKEFRRQDIDRALELPNTGNRIIALSERLALEVQAANARERIEDRRLENQKKHLVEEYKIQNESIKDTQEYTDTILSIEASFEALRKQNQERADRERREATRRANREVELLDPNSRRSLFGDTFADAFNDYNEALRNAGRNTNGFRATLYGLATAATDAFHQMSEDAGNFLSIALDGFRELTSGIGDLVTNYVLLGEIGPNALRKLLASIIAHYAASWIIKAIDLTAEGFGNLAKASAAAASGNLASAALYKAAAVQDFIAAAKYGAGGAIAAVVGRQVAGNAFAQEGGGASGNAASSTASPTQDNAPNNQSFNYGSNSPDASPSSRNNLFERVADTLEELKRQNAQHTNLIVASNNRVASALEPYEAATSEGIVIKGLGTNGGRRAAGTAIKEHSDEAPSFNRHLLANLGFGRT